MNLAPTLAAVAAACAFALPSTAQVRRATSGIEYELVIIEPWNTAYALATSNASGINNLNQVSGAASPITGSSSFLWTRAGGKQQVNLAGRINDQGVVAGANAIRWPDGSVEIFDLLSVAQDLNELNVVAGTWGTTTCGLSTSDEAGVWESSVGTTLLRDLGVVAAEHARAINDRGEVVGVRSWTGNCGDFEAFYFDLATQTHIDLHALLVGTGPGLTEAFDINDLGFVVGEAPNSGTVKPFLWHSASGFQFLPAPLGGAQIDTHFASVNNHNQAVGSSASRAVIWEDARGTRDLNDLTQSPRGFTIDAAKEINDNGWIIGSGHYGVWSPERAVVLVPVPIRAATRVMGLP